MYMIRYFFSFSCTALSPGLRSSIERGRDWIEIVMELLRRKKQVRVIPIVGDLDWDMKVVTCQKGRRQLQINLRVSHLTEERRKSQSDGWPKMNVSSCSWKLIAHSAKYDKTLFKVLRCGANLLNIV